MINEVIHVTGRGKSILGRDRKEGAASVAEYIRCQSCQQIAKANLGGQCLYQKENMQYKLYSIHK